MSFEQSRVILVACSDICVAETLMTAMTIDINDLLALQTRRSLCVQFGLNLRLCGKSIVSVILNKSPIWFLPRIRHALKSFPLQLPSSPR